MTTPLLSSIALLAFALPCAAQVIPDAPKPHFDRTDWALLAADAGSRALDTYSTRWALENGNHEKFLPDFISHNTARLAIAEGVMVGVDYLVARQLVRHRHPKLAKVALMVDFAQDAPWAIHNLYLPERKAGLRVAR